MNVEVKQDLRSLRHLNHTIAVLLEAKNNHEKRIAYLEELHRYDEIEEEKKAIARLNVEGFIRNSERLERKYAEAIELLDPLDRAIITDAYINGKAYWKIGQDIGFTTEGIKKRVAKAINKIAEKMKKDG